MNTFPLVSGILLNLIFYIPYRLSRLAFHGQDRLTGRSLECLSLKRDINRNLELF
jgi:hypothetical protein